MGSLFGRSADQFVVRIHAIVHNSKCLGIEPFRNAHDVIDVGLVFCENVVERLEGIYIGSPHPHVLTVHTLRVLRPHIVERFESATINTRQSASNAPKYILAVCVIVVLERVFVLRERSWLGWFLQVEWTNDCIRINGIHFLAIDAFDPGFPVPQGVEDAEFTAVWAGRRTNNRAALTGTIVVRQCFLTFRARQGFWHTLGEHNSDSAFLTGGLAYPPPTDSLAALLCTLSRSGLFCDF